VHARLLSSTTPDCAVLDLDGVLVKSDWNRERGWRTFKRPGTDAFLKHMAQARTHTHRHI
jgi:hypothetical protein